MKKTLLFLAAVLAIAGCAKKEIAAPVSELGFEPEDIVATFEDDATKTSLGDNGSVLWRDGDKITLLYKGTNLALTYTLRSGAGSTSATFAYSGEFSETETPAVFDEYYGIYPAQEGATIADGKFSVTIPYSQDYSPASFDEKAAVMTGISTSTSISFKNATGLLKVFVTPTVANMPPLYRVKSITLTTARTDGASAKLIAGPAKVAINGGAELESGATNSITLWGNEYAVLNHAEAYKDRVGNAYIFAIAPTIFEPGDSLNINIQLNDGSKEIVKGVKFGANGFKVARNTISTIAVGYSLDDITAGIEKPVAEIGNVRYYTLAEAVAAAESGDKITLAQAVAENIEIPADKEITIDLNEAYITGGTVESNGNKAAIVNHGTLTITGKGTIKREDNDSGLTASKSYYVIDNQGTMTIGPEVVVRNNSGVQEGHKGSSLVRNGSEGVAAHLVINGATLEQPNFNVIKNEGFGSTVTIKEGSTIGSAGQLNYAILSYDPITIEGGTINGPLCFRSYDNEYCTATIQGGVINGNITVETYPGNTPDHLSSLSITGGTINGTLNTGIGNGTTFTADTTPQEHGQIAVSGGVFKADPSAYVADGYMAKYDKTAKVYNVTECDMVIRTVDDLVAFAAAVNAGDNYKDKEVVLLADLDLTGVDFTPISQSNYWFAGVFDGLNHKISNLNVNTPSTNRAALFGGLSHGTVKNLSLENPTIQGGADYTAAVCASGNGTIKNVTVKGGSVKGGDQVGGIAGFMIATTIDGCTLDGTTIEATGDRAGGIIGKIDGQNSFHLDNNTLKGVTVKAAAKHGVCCGAGGIASQLMTNTVSAGMSIKNNEIEVTTITGGIEEFVPIANLRDGYSMDPINTDNISGNHWVPETVHSIVISNGTSSVTIYNKDYVPTFVVEVDGVEYETLGEAIAAATSGKTIELIDDIEENVTIPAGKSLTLDLNGKTFNGKQTANTPSIVNEGTLTLQNGTIERSGAGSASYYVIENRGNLTLGDGLTVTGSANSSLIRNNAADAVMTINGGTYTQTGAFIVLKNDLGTVVVNGGEFSTAADSNVLNNWDSMTINDGSFTGCILNGAYDTNNNVLTIKDGTFNSKLIRTYLGNGKTDAPVNIEGGNFTNSAMKFVGTSKTENDTDIQVSITGGSFKVDPSKYVASPAAVIYANNQYTVVAEGIKAALAQATSGSTVMLLSDYSDNNESLSVPSGVTLDGKGNTITAKKAIKVGKQVVIKNVTVDQSAAPTAIYSFDVNNDADQDLTLESVKSFGNPTTTKPNVAMVTTNGGNFTFRNCEFENWLYYIHTDGTHSNVLFENCKMQNTNYGDFIGTTADPDNTVHGTVKYKNCTIIGGKIQVCSYSKIEFIDNVIDGTCVALGLTAHSTDGAVAKFNGNNVLNGANLSYKYSKAVSANDKYDISGNYWGGTAKSNVNYGSTNSSYNPKPEVVARIVNSGDLSAANPNAGVQE